MESNSVIEERPIEGRPIEGKPEHYHINIVNGLTKYDDNNDHHYYHANYTVLVSNDKSSDSFNELWSSIYEFYNKKKITN